MGFWLQLKIIIWKNFLFRKRQKTRLVIELVWPLILFLILMWVRTRGLITNVPECHLTQKAMPSTGFLPFLQTFVCTFGNDCYLNKEDAEVVIGNITSEGAEELLQKIEELMLNESSVPKINNKSGKRRNVEKDNSKKNSVNIRQFLKNSTYLYNNIKENGLNISKDGFNQFIDYNISHNNFKMSPLSLLYDNHSLAMCNDFQGMSTSFYEFCDLNQDELNILRHLLTTELSKTIDVDLLEYYFNENLDRYVTWNKWYKTLTTLLSAERNMGSYLIEALREGSSNETDKYLVFYNLISSFLCGNKTTHLDESAKSINRLDSIQEHFRDRASASYQYDTEISEECNAVFKILETNENIKGLWRVLKPFYVGQILYTPVTPVTERIMSHVNKSFETFRLLRDFFLHHHKPGQREENDRLWSTFFSAQEFLNSPLGQKKFSRSSNNPFFKEDNYLKRVSNVNETFNEREAFNTAGNIPQSNFMMTMLKCYNADKIRPFESVEEAETEAMRLIGFNKLWGFVDFLSPGEDQLTPLTTYKIRMNTERLDSTEYIQDRMLSVGPRRRPTFDLKYITFGFAYLQDLVDRSIIFEHTGRKDLPGIILQQFPYPCYIQDDFIVAISRTFPLFMVLSWTYSCSMVVKSIVYEKEERLKETMRVMGLGNLVHWFGWFIDSIIPISISLIALVLVLIFGKILTNSEITVVYVFLFVYGLAAIAQAFLISVFFSKANIAAACTGIIFFILYLPYAFLAKWMTFLSTFQKIFMCLSANVALGVGSSYIAFYEEKGVGLKWDNIGKSPLYNDDFSLAIVTYLLIFDTFLYLILTWYIEAVFPGEYGIPKPWYFPLTRSYWSGKDYRKVSAINEDEQESDTQKNFESYPTNLNVGVKIIKLRKQYKNGKVSVDNISVNFYEGQITSFLGHNGAGKTTTIMMLTGLFPPTSGTAKINGHDIRTDMDKIRGDLGMCPQHNVLFSKLTVEEHLLFYGILRSGTTKNNEQLKNEIEEMLVDLGLPDKRNALVSTLSGGMQRKLSVAVAFIGGSRTVILDEPTSGVDPYSRRSIWDLLIKYKKSRTVILTTHYMDEADLLGDRIAIISNGKVVCYGTSLYLKKTFGSGYQLTIEMPSYSTNGRLISEDDKISLEYEDLEFESAHTSSQPKHREPLTDVPPEEPSSSQPKPVEPESGVRSEEQPSSPPKPVERAPGAYSLEMSRLSQTTSLILNKDIAELISLIEEIMPTAIFMEHIGSEVTFTLPERDITHLTKLCDALDRFIKKNIIVSYGISDTSLEEIFIRFGDSPVVPVAPPKGLARSGIEFLLKKFRIVKEPLASAESSIYSSLREKFVQMNWASVKYIEVPVVSESKISQKPPNKYWRQFKALHIKRFFHTIRNKKGLFSEIVLPPIFICIALLVTSILPTLQERPPLELDLSLYAAPRYIFFTNNATSNETSEGIWANKYIQSVLSRDGLGFNCLEINGRRDSQCAENSRLNPSKGNRTKVITCSCSTGAQNCPADIDKIPPPSYQLVSEDILVNMTKEKETLSHWIINTWPKYEEHRIGGYTFAANVSVPSANYPPIRDMFETASPFRFFPGLFSPPTSNHIKVWFNNKAWISSVAYMNAINNVILRTSLNSSINNTSEFGIRTINHPMNFTKKQFDMELIRQGAVSILHAISVIFALSFVPASFTLYLIEERASHSKHLIMVSGANRLIFWVEELVWDFVAYTIAAMLCVLVFVLYNEKAYVSSTNLPGTITLFIVYGWAIIPLMYLLSYLFKVPSSAFVSLACGNVIVGIVTTMTVFVLEAFEDEELKEVLKVLKEVFLIFPHYCLGRGVLDLAQNYYTTASLFNLDINYRSYIFEWEILGKPLFAMVILGAVFFALTLAKEFNLFSGFCGYGKKKQQNEMNSKFEDDDEDVAAERERVHKSGYSNDILVIKNLTKVYQNAQEPSVNNICVGIKEGECFGLLGINGAGKTTTFKMLTGAVSVTSGDATVKGYSVVTNMGNVHSLVGYCPQFDALDPLLTPREHLLFYGRIKNIPPATLECRVEGIIENLGLKHYTHRLSGTLSGGNKRKLSAAIALIGNPPLIFLDEPTTGMDPKARRFLWSRIQEIVKTGTSVVLTSHSMEECQALCTRLTVMVNGQFKCIGTSQHLKNKYGRGYTLVIRCEENNKTTIKEFMKSSLKSSAIIEEHLNQITYEIPEGRISDILHELENAKAKNLIDDYSLSQTTLEEVFLHFASSQKGRPSKFKRKKVPAYVKKCLSCCKSNKEE